MYKAVVFFLSFFLFYQCDLWLIFLLFEKKNISGMRLVDSADSVDV